MTHTRAALLQYRGLVGAFLLLGLAYLFAPLAETRYWPVTTPFERTAVASVQDGAASELAGGAVKLRGGCEYRGVEVFLGERGNGVRIPGAHFKDRPQERGKGRQEWQRLYIPVPEFMIDQTFADVLHACYRGERYLTRTHFW